ncbi:MAG: archaeosine biosynthesis radical SAM protein RaSEA [Candidatus Thorarchaeota archaeon]
MSGILDEMQDLVKRTTANARGISVTKRRAKNPNKPAAAWTIEARIGSETGTALSIVLSTEGCSHARGSEGGCTMCSYLLDGTSTNPSSDELLNQFREATKKLEDVKSPISVKIYTSGSFLDIDEIPTEARNQILTEISSDERIKEVVLESRPEYVQDSILKEVRSLLGSRSIELAMGLESSSDLIRSLCINKNFDFTDFKKAVEIGKKYDIGTRAYILLKPPFLTERDALIDAQKTISDAIDAGASTVSLNPVNIQSKTLVESLWQKQRYRPPWLWTVVDVLRYGHEVSKGTARIVCDPAAAGKKRGTHNCGKCDKSVISAIRQFSLKQDIHTLDGLQCECKNLWNYTLIHEDVSLLVHL